MELTRRGWATLALIAATITMAWLFGARALNAVVAPLIVAILAGAIQIRLAREPTVDRSQPRAGFPGETREVSLEVQGSTGTVLDGRDRLGEGLTSGDATFAGTTPLAHTHEVTLQSRGRRRLGPTTVAVRDVLGLVRAEYETGGTATILVYPHVVSVARSDSLTGVVSQKRTAVRQEFDRVREYVPGDPLRDINWKASAKRLPDLVLTEFADRRNAGRVTVAGGGDPDQIDTVASAVASIGLFLMDNGLQVGIAVPDGRLEPGRSERHRTAMLELLAETGAGRPEQSRDADVLVDGHEGDVTVRIDGQAVPWSVVAGLDDDQRFRSIAYDRGGAVA